MEPKQNTQNTQSSAGMNPFYDRPYEEEEDGYIDDRGFYTSTNGSFWDDDHNYFNHLGFDKHGGTYDKFGIYQPGPNYNSETGMYEEEEKNFEPILEKEKKKPIFGQRFDGQIINELQLEEKQNEKTIKKFAELIESDNESDDEEEEKDKSNVSFDINDMEEAFGYVMDVENHSNNNNITSQHV